MFALSWHCWVRCTWSCGSAKLVVTPPAARVISPADSQRFVDIDAPANCTVSAATAGYGPRWLADRTKPLPPASMNESGYVVKACWIACQKSDRPAEMRIPRAFDRNRNLWTGEIFTNNCCACCQDYPPPMINLMCRLRCMPLLHRNEYTITSILQTISSSSRLLYNYCVLFKFRRSFFLRQYASITSENGFPPNRKAVVWAIKTTFKFKFWPVQKALQSLTFSIKSLLYFILTFPS